MTTCCSPAPDDRTQRDGRRRAEPVPGDTRTRRQVTRHRLRRLIRSPEAAERLLFVKLFNAGQICTTVDHVFVPQAKVDEFVELARRIVPARYPGIDAVDYTSVIDDRAFIAHNRGAGECAATRRHAGPAGARRALERRHPQDRAAYRAERPGRLRIDEPRNLWPGLAGIRLPRAREVITTSIRAPVRWRSTRSATTERACRCCSSASCPAA